MFPGSALQRSIKYFHSPTINTCVHVKWNCNGSVLQQRVDSTELIGDFDP